MKADVKIFRDLAKFPSVVNINIGGRKLTAEFDPEKGLTIEGSRAHLPSFSEILRMIYPVTSVLTIRGQNWFDRNARSVVDDYDSGVVGPHALTLRLTYTVPEDTITMVELLNLSVLRTTASTIIGVAGVYVSLTVPDDIERYIAEAEIYSNPVGSNQRISIGATMTLFPGTILNAYTRDTSGDGVTMLTIAYKLTEFDA